MVRKITELNEIERGEIVQSADFGHFFNKATRTMERAIYLADKFNLTRDFVDDDRRSASGFATPFLVPPLLEK